MEVDFCDFGGTGMVEEEEVMDGGMKCFWDATMFGIMLVAVVLLL